MKKSVLAAAALAAMGFTQQASAYSFEATYDVSEVECSALSSHGCDGHIPVNETRVFNFEYTPNTDAAANTFQFTSYDTKFPSSFTTGVLYVAGFGDLIGSYGNDSIYFTMAPFMDAYNAGLSPTSLSPILSQAFGYRTIGSISAFLRVDYSLTNFRDTTVMAAVPEPETYAMMLAGMGLMGFVARRRKRG